jgi:hypothetical protein
MQGELSDGYIVYGSGGAGTDRHHLLEDVSNPRSQTFAGHERFVDAEVVADFLSMPRREVAKLTREGKLTGYAISGTRRLTYKYRLSEVAEDLANFRKPRTIVRSSPSDSKPGRIHG